ncbi:MAG TPA: 16S rRNA (cytidine(1402)-2'-O)-methyltransferase, partial [Patescibacteria group bacterium]|nr:16S rRNA (cytidine(1402)-2'-O)-methyltransferase [Patescibacteria group bacterium]
MGKLAIVATPIGNLEDITLRALKVLKEADLVLCEDTRVTRKLLEKYQIKTPTLSYHQHSGKVKSDRILTELESGKAVALVTDAGTPGVSDPGGKLVAEAVASGHQVESIPGPSALTAAIAVAGLPLDKFLFLGFLPHKKGRQTLLKGIAESKYPVILYESVHRIGKLLDELPSSADIVIARELTKKFETVYRGTVEEVKKQLVEKET